MPPIGSVAGYSEDVLLASAAQTTNGQTGTLSGYGGASTLLLFINIQSFVGGASPTVSIFLEHTLDGTNWVQVATAATLAVGVTTLAIPATTLFADRIRVRWTLQGAPTSATFEVRSCSQSPLT